MQVRLYQSGAEYWLGSRSISGGEGQVQPVLGPLASDGLRFEPRAANGSPAGTPADARMIALTLRGVTAGAIAGGMGAPAIMADSLAVAVELRNVQ